MKSPHSAKGQSALEYLMTYGWALVVIVIVIAALFAFGVFSTPQTCSQTGGSMLVKEYAIGTTGITLALQNGSPGLLTNISLATSNVVGCTGLSAAAGNPAMLTRTDVNLFTLNGSCTGSVNVPIAISYRSSTGIPKTETTTCSGSV